MNRQQLGVVAVSIVAVLALSLTAATLGSSVDGATRGTSSGVFTDENVTLKDDPAPEINVSNIPWLKAYFQYFEPKNQSTAPNASSVERARRSDILPVLVAVAGGLTLVALVIGIWLRWLRGVGDDLPEPDLSASDESDTEEPTVSADPEWNVEDNAVYRAWYEMARRIDAGDWEARTPRELAALAAERGMDSHAVEELTAQFERIRYRNEPVTPEREERVDHLLETLGIDTGTEPSGEPGGESG